MCLVISHQIRSTVRYELAQTIGRTIARWRATSGMTQEALAGVLDLDPMTVSRFERGATLPSLVTLQQIATVFGVTMAQLLEEEPPSSVDDTAVIARLIQNFSSEERAFVLDTLKRYRTIRRKSS